MRLGSELSDPGFFAVTDFAVVDTTRFEGLPTKAIGRHLYIIELSTNGLECPDTDPIGVYHYAGIRRFMWRGRLWSEYNFNANSLLEQIGLQIKECQKADDALRLRHLLDLVKAYAVSTGFTSEDAADDQAGHTRKFYRAIYQIGVVN